MLNEKTNALNGVNIWFNEKFGFYHVHCIVLLHVLSDALGCNTYIQSEVILLIFIICFTTFPVRKKAHCYMYCKHKSLFF